jgi:hypothetical protein
MGPETSLVHKSTYAPMIYTAMCIMFWMRAYPLLGKVGGGWAQPPPTCPHDEYARIQNIMHGAV